MTEVSPVAANGDSHREGDSGRRKGRAPLPHDEPVEEGSPAAHRRPRRPAGTLQPLLLDAARQTFAERGYAGSTTRAIAGRAGVAEALLFRSFGSKANLFAEAVLLPMAELLEGCIPLLEHDIDQQIERLQRRLVDHLYQNVRRNRGLLLSLLTTSAFEPEVIAGHDAVSRMQYVVGEIAAACEDRLARTGVDVSDMDVQISSRAAIAMVFAASLFGDWLLRPGLPVITVDDVVDELSRLLLYGAFNLQREAPTADPCAPPPSR